MSQHPPSSGPGRQPLQTFLGSGVRQQQPSPAAAIAQTPIQPPQTIPPVAAVPPPASAPAPASASPPTDGFLSGGGSSAPNAASFPAADVFATPSLFGSVAPRSSGTAPPPNSLGSDHLSSLLNTSPSSTPRNSVFGESTFTITSPAQNQQQQQNNLTSPGVSSLNTTAVSPAPNTGAFPTPSGSTINSPAPTRLEQTSEHPLLGSGAPVGSGTLFPPPLAGRNSAISPGFPPTRSPSVSGGIAPPARMVRASSTPLSAAASNPLQPSTPAQQPSPSIEPPASPDEKLSTLLAALFQGTPPPAKLAEFDVSTMPRTEEGLQLLADHGCWREMIRVAEIMLDAKDPSASTRLPHETYRIIHLHLIGLLKLRKTDQAQSILQTKVGNTFASDKLYASHTQYTSQSASQYVGNMLPFELHLLSSEILHHHGGRTRASLDSLMKLLAWIKACLQRKKNEESGNTTEPTLEKRASVIEGSTGLTTTSSNAITSNPFSIHSPHTATSLTLSQLQANLRTLKLHIVNLCLSFSSPAEIDFVQALSWLSDLIAEYPNDPTLLEFHAKILLQMGDAARGSVLLQKARGIYEERGEEENVQIGLHQVLLHLARNDYTLAHTTIAALYVQHPFHIEVVNNFSVCSLYVNEIQAGIQALEALIRKDPINNLQESVLSNLRALYDLASQNPALKRRLLEGLALQYGSDDLALEQQQQ